MIASQPARLRPVAAQQAGPVTERFATRVLQWGVALLGLTLSLTAASGLTLAALPVVIRYLVVAIAMVTGLGRLLGIPRALTTLIAVGTRICGISAIAVTAPLTRARGEEIRYATAVILLLTVAHRSESPAALRAAAGSVTQSPPRRVASIPWFLYAFVAFCVLRTTVETMPGALEGEAQGAWNRLLSAAMIVSEWCFMLAMSAVGLQTRLARTARATRPAPRFARIRSSLADVEALLAYPARPDARRPARVGTGFGQTTPRYERNSVQKSRSVRVRSGQSAVTAGRSR